jgi:voltage-gated potassium channel
MVASPRLWFTNRWMKLLAAPVVLIAIGTVGLHWTENLPWFQALYLTVITLTTVGYGDVVPQSIAGQVFIMVFVLVGVFTLFYVATTLIGAVVSGEVVATLGRQQMEQRLALLQRHYIVCGYGRMGRLVCHELDLHRIPHVVIDIQPATFEKYPLKSGIALPGDATSDEVLQHAGVTRAKGLIAVASSDADNLYITMSARLLNDKLFIIARAEDERSEDKLRRAGANRAISPYRIGGVRMAQAVLRPTVLDFIELVTKHTHLELQIEECRVHAGSKLVGTTLKDSRLRPMLNLIIVAIKKASGKMLFNPSAETVLEAEDTLVVLGDRENLDNLLTITRGPKMG